MGRPGQAGGVEEEGLDARLGEVVEDAALGQGGLGADLRPGGRVGLGAGRDRRLRPRCQRRARVSACPASRRARAPATRAGRLRRGRQRRPLGQGARVGAPASDGSPPAAVDRGAPARRRQPPAHSAVSAPRTARRRSRQAMRRSSSASDCAPLDAGRPAGLARAWRPSAPRSRRGARSTRAPGLVGVGRARWRRRRRAPPRGGPRPRPRPAAPPAPRAGRAPARRASASSPPARPSAASAGGRRQDAPAAPIRSRAERGQQRVHRREALVAGRRRSARSTSGAQAARHRLAVAAAAPAASPATGAGERLVQRDAEGELVGARVGGRAARAARAPCRPACRRARRCG